MIRLFQGFAHLTAKMVDTIDDFICSKCTEKYRLSTTYKSIATTIQISETVVVVQPIPLELPQQIEENSLNSSSSDTEEAGSLAIVEEADSPDITGRASQSDSSTNSSDSESTSKQQRSQNFSKTQLIPTHLSLDLLETVQKQSAKLLHIHR